ncbi:MAG: hypothetical protein WAK03_16610 [Methylocystis sp.]
MSDINLLPIFQQLEPFIVSAVGAIIIALGGWIVTVIHKYMGITVDSAMEKTLEQTATNAANHVIAGLEGPISNLKIDINSPAVDMGVEYLITHAPDAVAYFEKTYNFTPLQLQELILAKLGSAQIAAHPSNFNAENSAVVAVSAPDIAVANQTV